MNKLEFNQLELHQQVQYINDQLVLGSYITKVCDAIGIDRSTVRKRFKKGGMYLILTLIYMRGIF